MKKIIAVSCFIILGFGLAKADDKNIGRYQISADGSFIIDTTDGRVRPNNQEEYNIHFDAKSTGSKDWRKVAQDSAMQKAMQNRA